MENPMNPSEHLSGDQLSDLAEGVASALEKIEYDLHLNQCEQCHRELSILKIYFNEMKFLPTTPAPANFLANVRTRIEKPSMWKNFLAQLSMMRKWVPAQIALLTLLGVGIISTYLYQGRGSLDAEQSKDVASVFRRKGDVGLKSNAESKLKDNLSAATGEALTSNQFSALDAIRAAGMATARGPSPKSLAPSAPAAAPLAKREESAPIPSPTASTAQGILDVPVAAKKSAAVMRKAESSSLLDITLHLDKTKELKSFLSQSEALGISQVLKLADRAIAIKSKTRSAPEQNLEFEIPLDKSQAWINLLREYGQVDSIQPLSASKTTIWLRIIQP